MAYGFVPIVHIVAVVFSIVELGLTAYAVSVYDNDYGWAWSGSHSPDQLNFMLFNSIWSLLVLAYIGLAPLYLRSIFHGLASLGLEVITAIFWFAGSIALAVGFGGPYSCGSDHLCGSIEAAIAFGFFLWALFTGLAVVDTIEFLRSRRRHTGEHHMKHHHHSTTPYAGA